jgi:hypothetical protein
MLQNKPTCLVSNFHCTSAHGTWKPYTFDFSYLFGTIYELRSVGHFFSKRVTCTSVSNGDVREMISYKMQAFRTQNIHLNIEKLL